MIDMQELTTYLSQHPKRVLIFDFDETLCTLQLPWDIYAERMMAGLLSIAPELRREDFPDFARYENAVVRAVGEAGSRIRLQISTQFEEEFLGKYSEHLSLTNFIREHREYIYFLWSSNVRSTINTMLTKIDLLQYFISTVTKTDVTFAKPEAEGFVNLIAPQLDKVLPSWQLSDVLMVGNSEPSDAGAARAAGIASLLVTQGV